MELIKQVLERAGAQVSIVSQDDRVGYFVCFFTNNKNLAYNVHQACIVERLNNDAWQLIAQYPTFTEHAINYIGWSKHEMHYKLFAKKPLNETAKRYLPESIQRLGDLIEKSIASPPVVGRRTISNEIHIKHV